MKYIIITNTIATILILVYLLSPVIKDINLPNVYVYYPAIEQKITKGGKGFCDKSVPYKEIIEVGVYDKEFCDKWLEEKLKECEQLNNERGFYSPCGTITCSPPQIGTTTEEIEIYPCYNWKIILKSKKII